MKTIWSSREKTKEEAAGRQPGSHSKANGLNSDRLVQLLKVIREATEVK
jgi:hypothetical protein